MRKKSEGAELFESVQAVLAEKRALLVRQKGLIEALNRVLARTSIRLFQRTPSCGLSGGGVDAEGEDQDGHAGGRRRSQLAGAG